MVDVIKADFRLCSPWRVDTDGEKWQDKDVPKYLIDGSTGRKYLNESKGCVRTKCFLLSIGTPLYQPIIAAVNIFIRFLLLITLAHFWIPSSDNKYHFKARLKEAGFDLARIVFSPIAILGLELASIYGWISPYNGRKLYSTIERLFYESYALAPCFQPNPQRHAFGGDINRRNQY